MNKKSLLTLLSVVVISAIVLTGTLAYLQDKSVTVKNEFDKHTVYVDLDENGDGQYDIIPGTTEPKDPKVTVTTDIDSYVFLEVDDKTQGVVEYAIANGWLPLTYVDEEGDTVTVDGVYYRILDVSETTPDADTEHDYSFGVLKDDEVAYSSELTNYDIEKLTGDLYLAFTAYAIQQNPFETAYAAWDAAKGNAKAETSDAKDYDSTKETTLSVGVVPGTDAGNNAATTVTIPAGANTAAQEGDSNLFDDATVAIFVETESTAVEITDGDNTVATINISLYVNNQKTTTEENTLTGGKYYTVTTYITKGLTDPKLTYGEEPFSKVETINTANQFTYNSETGELVFTTTHFSEFVVKDSEATAYIAATDTAYTSLQAAIDSVEDSTTNAVTVTLLRNVTDAAGLATDSTNADNHKKNIIIDFNGFTYSMKTPAVGSSGTETQAMHWAQYSTVVMKNGSYVVQSDAENVKMGMQNYCDLTIENMTIDLSAISVGNYGNDYTGNNAKYNGKEVPVFNNNGRTGTKLTITDSTILVNSSASYAVYTETELYITNSTLNAAVALSKDNANFDPVAYISGTTCDVKSYFDGYSVQTATGTDDHDGYTVYSLTQSISVSGETMEEE